MPAPRINPLLHARIEHGNVVWLGIDGKRFNAVKKFLEGAEVGITIERWKKKRSLKQNAYYWSVVTPMIAEAAGYLTPEEAHDALRMHFLLKHGDTPMPTIGSTTELSTTEFEEYLSKVRQLAAEMFGLYIPLPSEVPEEQHGAH